VTANRFFDLLANDTLDIAAPDMARWALGVQEDRTHL
jgi:hypothetical protein